MTKRIGLIALIFNLALSGAALAGGYENGSGYGGSNGASSGGSTTCSGDINSACSQVTGGSHLGAATVPNSALATNPLNASNISSGALPPAQLGTTQNFQLGSVGVGVASDTTSGDFLYANHVLSSLCTSQVSIAGEADICNSNSQGGIYLGGSTAKMLFTLGYGGPYARMQFTGTSAGGLEIAQGGLSFGVSPSASAGVVTGVTTLTASSWDNVTPVAIASLPACSSTIAGARASVTNSDAACSFGVAPTHASCTVGTNCWTCQVQCAESGSTTYSWLAY